MLELLVTAVSHLLSVTHASCLQERGGVVVEEAPRDDDHCRHAARDHRLLLHYRHAGESARRPQSP